MNLQSILWTDHGKISYKNMKNRQINNIYTSMMIIQLNILTVNKQGNFVSDFDFLLIKGWFLLLI